MNTMRVIFDVVFVVQPYHSGFFRFSPDTTAIYTRVCCTSRRRAKSIIAKCSVHALLTANPMTHE